jgi:hypothetical protein
MDESCVGRVRIGQYTHRCHNRVTTVQAGVPYCTFHDPVQQAKRDRAQQQQQANTPPTTTTPSHAAE